MRDELLATFAVPLRAVGERHSPLELGPMTSITSSELGHGGSSLQP